MKDKKLQSFHIYLGLLFVGVLVYLQNANKPGMFMDGYLYAAFGKNAALHGKWLIPHLSHSLYSEFSQHLPFVFILEGLFFKIFGISFASARLFSSLASLGTLSLIFYGVRKYRGNKAAYLSGLCFILIPPLMKKTRFPNMDIFLMLFTYLSAWFFYQASELGKNKDFLLSGLFFGMALLTKGPPAILILPGFCLYMILAKKWTLAKNPWAWIGLVFGGLVFMIWPLSLYLSGRLDIIHGYYQQVFVYTIKDGRGAEAIKPLTYLIFLLKTSPLWLIFIFYGLKKKFNDSFYLFHFSIFLAMLIFLSLARFKYSHYLIPLYPFLAVGAGLVLSDLIKEKWYKGTFYFFRYLAMIAAVILIFTDLGSKITRDPQIFSIIKDLDKKNIQPEGWMVVDDAYPYFSLANLVGFVRHREEVVRVDSASFHRWLKNEVSEPKTPDRYDNKVAYNGTKWLFIMRKEQFIKLPEQFKASTYIREFPKKNFVALYSGKWK